jgi:hypothetical protein
MLSFFVMPAVQAVGPDGGKVVIALMRRRLDVFIASISGLTVLSGLYLYWVLTDGFSAGPSSTMRARVVGTGAVLGLAAAIVGGSIVARNMKKVVALMTQASGVSDGAARSTLMAQAAQIRQKVATGGRLVAILLFVTTILMVVGAHFV